MKIYDWQDVKIAFGISVNRTYAQRYYVAEKIKKILSDNDYVLKSKYINLCLFKNSAMKKIKSMLGKARYSKIK